MTVYSVNNKELLYVLRENETAQGSHLAWFNKVALAFSLSQSDLSKLVLLHISTARHTRMVSY